MFNDIIDGFRLIRDIARGGKWFSTEMFDAITGTGDAIGELLKSLFSAKVGAAPLMSDAGQDAELGGLTNELNALCSSEGATMRAGIATPSIDPRTGISPVDILSWVQVLVGIVDMIRRRRQQPSVAPNPTPAVIPPTEPE